VTVGCANIIGIANGFNAPLGITVTFDAPGLADTE
jgi:hypothetical protein